jgi:uncharacterized protein (DUF1684 family)
MKLLTMCVYAILVALLFSTGGCREADTPGVDSTAAEKPKAEMTGDPYQAEITKFQQDREAALKTDTGWLTIAGLFFLTQSVTTFGSDPLNDIVLPAGAPARAGTFELRNGKVTVKAADGVTFQLDGKSITSAELKPDGQGPPDRISLGDLTLWVHNSGDRLSIRLRDKNSPLRKEFAGTSWFPINSAYRVEATYAPYDKPKMVQVPNILGDMDAMPVPGIVTFAIDEREYKLEPVAEPGDPQFWFIFRDLTSQDESYPAARFLYAPAPVNGKMILDFNRAQNPPCAYNPYTTCPLPSEQNRLRVRIEAGEKKYTGHS